MTGKTAIIASNGTLFDAYKVYNIATAAVASDHEGLSSLHLKG